MCQRLCNIPCHCRSYFGFIRCCCCCTAALVPLLSLGSWLYRQPFQHNLPAPLVSTCIQQNTIPIFALALILAVLVSFCCLKLPVGIMLQYAVLPTAAAPVVLLSFFMVAGLRGRGLKERKSLQVPLEVSHTMAQEDCHNSFASSSMAP